MSAFLFIFGCVLSCAWGWLLGELLFEANGQQRPARLISYALLSLSAFVAALAVFALIAKLK
jgi:hypothetical protein